MENAKLARETQCPAGLARAVDLAVHDNDDVADVADFLALPGSATARYHRMAATRETYALTVELGCRVAYVMGVGR